MKILEWAFWRNKEMSGRVQIPMKCHKKVLEVGNKKIRVMDEVKR